MFKKKVVRIFSCTYSAIGVGETCTKSKLHSPRSPFAATNLSPVNPVSSSMISFKVTYELLLPAYKV